MGGKATPKKFALNYAIAILMLNFATATSTIAQTKFVVPPGQQGGPAGMPAKQGCDADCMRQKINDDEVRVACLGLKLATDRAEADGREIDDSTRYELQKCAAQGNLDIRRR